MWIVNEDGGAINLNQVLDIYATSDGEVKVRFVNGGYGILKKFDSKENGKTYIATLVRVMNQAKINQYKEAFERG